MKVTVIPIVIGAFGTITKNLGKRLGELEIKGKYRDHPNHSIAKINSDT